jgi:hypothetical protein
MAGIALLIFLFYVWYTIAADYGYSAVSGTYVMQHNGEMCTLVLNKDRSFEQELIRNGNKQQARGSWRRIGEGGVVFSKQFLKLPGQQVPADGQAFGEVENTLGLFLSLALNPVPDGPVFRKKLFP